MVRGDKSGTKEIDFYYDHNGMRTRKVVRENGREETTDYTLHGKLITHLTKRTVDENGEETNKDELHFFYDSNSKPAFVEYNGEKYRYIYNLQGDIVGILDSNNSLVVEYEYDAWGKPILTTDAFTSTLVNLNPFRYRGYIWDNESCLYCLCTRYYDYCNNRFLNADIFIGQIKRTFASNIFVYCYNGPVISIDSDGLDAVTVFVYTEKFSYGHAEIGFVDSNGQRIVYSFGRYADDAEKTDIVGEGILVIYQGSDVETSWNEHTGSPKSNGFWFKVDATDDQIKNMRSYINGLIENGKPYRGKSSSRRPKYVIGTYHIIEQNCVVLVREVLRAGFGKDLPKSLNNVWTPTGLKRKLDRLSEKRYFIYARNECMK